MLKAGLLPSPIICPLSSDSLLCKNKIDAETFVEIRCDTVNVRIYFTVDGSKPDPFQTFRTGQTSTHLYRGAFRLEPGKRVIKAIAVTEDGLRESHVTTKYIDVTDIYFEENNYNTNRIEHIHHIIPETPPRITDIIYEEENFWHRKATPISCGNGNWKRTLEHIFLNVYNYVKDEYVLREIFGWKLFGRIDKTYLVDKGDTYHIVAAFKKPLGEKISFDEIPVRKVRSKRRPKRRKQTAPSHTDEEKPTYREENIKPEPKVYTIEFQEDGTVVPYPKFNVDKDCKNLQLAMKNNRENDDIFIEILANRSCDQRLEIYDQYKRLFKRNLDDDMKNNRTDDFCQILTSLLYSPIEYDCYELHRAINDFGIDQNALIEILASRSNKHLKAINQTYSKLFKETLESQISNNINGHLRRLLIVLLQGKRSESNRIDEREIENDVKSIYEAGNRKWSTNESIFMEILENRSHEQLQVIFNTYKQISKRDIEDDIKSETAGNLCQGLLAIVRITRNRPKFFAYQLENALKVHSDDPFQNIDKNQLNRVILSRCEIDTIQIKHEYETLTKQTLEKHIHNATKGHYRKILLELLKDPSERIETVTHHHVETQEREIYREENIQKGTMIAARNFNPDKDADELRKAMKGLGTDEKVLINILGNRNTSQRLDIKSSFKKKFNRDLTADLKSETSGNFSKLLERLTLNSIELDCFEMKQAVKGLGTDEEALIEILSSRSNERIKLIKETYKSIYTKKIEDDVRSDTSGNFRHLLVTLLKGNRPETIEVDLDQAKDDARALIDAGSQKFIGEDAKFNELFCNRSDVEMKCIFDEFKKLQRESIEDIARKETTGDHRDALLAIMSCLRSRPQFFAEKLHKSMKGLGTKESTLNRIILTRSEIDLVQIKETYKKLYNRELKDDVISDTSGDYKRLLLEILKDPSERH